jgi:site-specific DNA-cytosine methylase
MKFFIDLCSGLGGASEAFVQSDEWIVIRIENNPALQNIPLTHIFDVKQWVDWIRYVQQMIEAADTVVVWASPPCTEFSDGYSGPKPTAAREGREFEPDMSIVEACLDIIDIIQPDFWILENVRGSLKFFEPMIGKFKQQIHSFYLWGNFPHIDINPYLVHKKSSVDTTSSNPLRANIKAKVPMHVSEALLRSVDSFTDLRQWM